MVAYGWGTERPVADWLFEEGHRFEFFQAVKLLEMTAANRGLVAETADPRHEPVRFASRVGLSFPPSDVDAIVRPESSTQNPAMIVNFLGLAGAFGPLPTPYTELLLDRMAQHDTGLRAFLDMFNHRLVSLMYRVRKKHRIGFEHKPPQDTAFSRYVFSFLGLGTAGLQHRLHVPDRALLPYAGLLGSRPRSMAGLEGILREYFQIPVRGRPFLGQWLDLERDQQTRIGRRGANQRLGVNTVIGTRIWDQQRKFELVLGPLTFQQFHDLLPIGWGFRPLCELTWLYAGPEFDAQYRLRLKSSDVPTCTLSRTQGSRLGWTSWLRKESKEQADREVVLTRNSRQANLTKLRLPIFSDLPLDELTELVQSMVPRLVRAGTVLVRQGEPGQSLFFIDRGAVEVIARGFDGKERAVATLSAGSFFGEMSLLTGKPRTATVVATEETNVLELSQDRLNQILEKYPKVRRLLETYARNRAKGLPNG